MLNQQHQGHKEPSGKGQQSQGQGSQQDPVSGTLGGVVGAVKKELPADLSLIKISIGEVSYPSGKSELVEAAQRKGASTDVLDALQSLPDQMYESAEEVVNTIKGEE